MYDEKSRFYLVDRNYETDEVIVGLEELARRTKNLIRAGVIGEHFNPVKDGWINDGFERIKPYWRKSTIEFIIYDDENRVVPLHILDGIKVEETARGYKRLYRGTVNWTFRRDPVPYTGKGAWGYKSQGEVRHQKFIGELKQSIDADGCRPKRVKALKFFSVWLRYDDEYRSTVFSGRSWKKCKKRKQWM